VSAADVCLLLEGTYPFVRGGVSGWVHQLLTGLPELSFSLVFVGGRRSDYGEPKYTLPPNVKELEAHYLEDAYKDRAPRRVNLPGEKLEPARALHDYLKARTPGASRPAADVMENLERAVDGMLATLEEPRGLHIEDFLFGSGAWDFMREKHLGGDDDASFVDYFWTLRLMHGPIFQLARIAAKAPEARAYHSISTGYAGLLGAFLERRRRRPFILSEHGIYTKERRIDLNQAQWLDDLGPARRAEGQDGSATVRSLWIRYFEGLGRLTYRAADPIISLYAGNRERQHQDGAARDRTRVIVNGIQLERFREARESRPREIPHVIGLIGRVVPIKDVKTFVRTIQLVLSELPTVEGWIVGSWEEDPNYGEECQELARSLGVSERVKFVGHKDVREILPRLGLLMLTSISEAQPLAVLEAFAAGVPCVTTDVGACREQIEGQTPPDRALGAAGRVVPFADHEALGRAAIELLSDPEKWHACQAAGQERVRRFYAESTMLEAYGSVYRKALEQRWPE
jgi:glycosyltransferase involved in cell wall biosynthesis